MSENCGELSKIAIVSETTAELLERRGELAPSSLSSFTTWDELAPSGLSGFTTWGELAPSGLSGFTTWGELAPSGLSGLTTWDELAPSGLSGFTTWGELAPSGLSGFTTWDELAPSSLSGFTTNRTRDERALHQAKVRTLYTRTSWFEYPLDQVARRTAPRMRTTRPGVAIKGERSIDRKGRLTGAFREIRTMRSVPETGG
uniref:Uncharacterized protein n=1 Tax=Timema shepardi TaxID=629360 RepID=A0A7R9B7Z3_TIMSH|nr:unnamed protein product [Timema shepardi]